jgi:predicted Rossmann fold nucleotide-binding protein DprA/Smf involved in DNA uptake
MLVAGAMAARKNLGGDVLNEVKPTVGVLQLTPAMEQVLKAARTMRSLDYDQISQQTNLGIAQVMAAVTRLELGGIRLRN